MRLHPFTVTVINALCGPNMLVSAGYYNKKKETNMDEQLKLEHPHVATFTSALREALTKQVERHPERYVLGDKTVADFVKRDVESMATRGYCIAFGPAHRIAARACGIPGTFKAVLKYLGYVKPKTYTLAA